MPDDAPMLGSGDHPLAVGCYWQAPEGRRLRLPNGGYTKPHQLYLVATYEGDKLPVVCGGPYATDEDAEAAMRGMHLQPARGREDRRAA
jgi:hypothetical protein